NPKPRKKEKGLAIAECFDVRPPSVQADPGSAPALRGERANRPPEQDSLHPTQRSPAHEGDRIMSIAISSGTPRSPHVLPAGTATSRLDHVLALLADLGGAIRTRSPHRS